MKPNKIEVGQRWSFLSTGACECSRAQLVVVEADPAVGIRFDNPQYNLAGPVWPPGLDPYKHGVETMMMGMDDYGFRFEGA